MYIRQRLIRRPVRLGAIRHHPPSAAAAAGAVNLAAEWSHEPTTDGGTRTTAVDSESHNGTADKNGKGSLNNLDWKWRRPLQMFTVVLPYFSQLVCSMLSSSYWWKSVFYKMEKCSTWYVQTLSDHFWLFLSNDWPSLTRSEPFDWACPTFMRKLLVSTSNTAYFLDAVKIKLITMQW